MNRLLALTSLLLLACPREPASDKPGVPPALVTPPGVAPKLVLSTPSELLLRLRWLAILHGRTNMELSASGGAHTAEDVIKALMAGANTVQVVSALLKHGPEHIGVLRAGLEKWMVEHEYDSVRQMRGSMSLQRCPDPEAFERGNYAKVLKTWRPS